jgi:hypothetical protein
MPARLDVSPHEEQISALRIRINCGRDLNLAVLSDAGKKILARSKQRGKKNPNSSQQTRDDIPSDDSSQRIVYYHHAGYQAILLDVNRTTLFDSTR